MATNKALADISCLHPSKYLSCDDLKGRTITVKIASVDMEPVQMSDGSEEVKPVIRFEKANKAFIGGKTNDYSIAVLLSRKPLDWVGKRITLMPGTTTFGRDIKPCIRIAGSPDASPERAKAFDQARARTAQVDIKKQAKRFVAELKSALAAVDPVKVTETVAVPKLDPEQEEEKTTTVAKKAEDAFGLDGGES
jgi:hypothetical protein